MSQGTPMEDQKDVVEYIKEELTPTTTSRQHGGSEAILMSTKERDDIADEDDEVEEEEYDNIEQDEDYKVEEDESDLSEEDVDQDHIFGEEEDSCEDHTADRGYRSEENAYNIDEEVQSPGSSSCHSNSSQSSGVNSMTTSDVDSEISSGRSSRYNLRPRNKRFRIYDESENVETSLSSCKSSSSSLISKRMTSRGESGIVEVLQPQSQSSTSEYNLKPKPKSRRIKEWETIQDYFLYLDEDEENQPSCSSSSYNLRSRRRKVIPTSTKITERNQTAGDFLRSKRIKLEEEVDSADDLFRTDALDLERHLPDELEFLPSSSWPNLENVTTSVAPTPNSQNTSNTILINASQPVNNSQAPPKFPMQNGETQSHQHQIIQV
ncbi:hypothetical protein Ocin01_02977 [Orchesella cincta]|uniref:Uncharacterized protein n=1 Tax=Orchesella cincta TaxID=48709 RepID=A0A1D2NEK9_ORCCI|nr:hypothetical protein Ocin01_02977 [Orchesella cincta]